MADKKHLVVVGSANDRHLFGDPEAAVGRGDHQCVCGAHSPRGKGANQAACAGTPPAANLLPGSGVCCAVRQERQVCQEM